MSLRRGSLVTPDFSSLITADFHLDMSTVVSHTTTPQGDGSATWTPFPFDTEYTFPGLYAINAEKSPNHPAFVYDDEGGNVQIVYHKDLYSAVIKAGTIVSKHIGASGLDVQAPQAAVGILAVAGTFPSYLAMEPLNLIDSLLL